MDNFTVHIITPEQIEFEGEVESVTAPGEDGYFGVLAHHAPLLANLSEGKLTVRISSFSQKSWNIDGGFLEVHPDGVIVLVRHLVANKVAI